MYAAEEKQSRRPLRVAIIGAGPGGLVLAQLLNKDERFAVTVYERGTSKGDGHSLAGFRILMPPATFDCLRGQVDTEVQELLDRAVGLPQPQGNCTCLMDQYCRIKYRSDATEQARSMHSISRWRLRRALLHNSSNFVLFNRQFERYEADENSIRAFFADGESIECDVLVGADGAGSRIRKQLIPNSTRHDTGVTIIYFKAPFTPETEAMIPWGSGGMVLSPRKSMVISYFKNPEKPYGPYDLENIDPDDSFLMVGLGCYSDEFHNQSKSPDDMTPEELKDECIARARQWHPLLRSLVAIIVPNSVFVARIKTQDPIDPWETGSVTILGDAAHSMTPYLGKGASSAIADAISLAETLRSEGEIPLVKRLAEYEKSMLKRGFADARSSMLVHHLAFTAGNTPWRARLRNMALRALDMYFTHPATLPEPFPGMIQNPPQTFVHQPYQPYLYKPQVWIRKLKDTAQFKAGQDDAIWPFRRGGEDEDSINNWLEILRRQKSLEKET